METLRPVLRFGNGTFELRRSAPGLVAVLVACAVAVAAGSRGSEPLLSPPAPSRQATGLAALPAAAQASVSAALGRHDPRYHATPSAGTVTATNPRHGLAASFEAGAVVIAAGGESVRLTLAGAGRDGAIAPFTAVAPVARANRVELHRAGLTEWYENGPLGLEQGFTLRTRPRGTTPLVLRLHLGGTLAAKLDGRGGIAFERAGTPVLRYGGLAAWDAHGRALSATLALAGRALSLQVDDRGAQYPVTVDPFVERASLRAAAGAGGDELGTSVAVAGDTIVVGAVGDDGLRGAAYVFVEPAGGWTGLVAERARLTASDGISGDAFGQSVAISGDTVVVGAYGDDGNRGAAYVFRKPAAGWTGSLSQMAKLVASSRAPASYLGYAVGVDSGTVVVGAHGDSGGRAYIFKQPTGGWSGTVTPSAQLAPSAAGGSSLFGWAVDVSGTTVAVGAHGANSAYVFVEPASGWAGSLAESAKLAASDSAAGDGLGFAVAAGGATVVAGAPFAGGFAGRAYVFERPAAGWAGVVSQRARLEAAGASEELGVSVAVSGDTVAAGSWGDDSFTGAVYVFRRPGTGWAGTHTQDERLTVADRAAGDGLGGSVGLDGSTIAAGASADDGDRGSARVFTSQAAGDLAPPAVSIALSPSAPDGNNGWYRSAVRVTVGASDPSGVSDLRCSLDPATAPASFAALPAGCGFAGAGAMVGANGAHAIYAGARDTAGNESAPTSTGFRVDRTPPTVTCLPSQTFVVGGSGGPVSATVTDGTSGPLSATVSAAASTSSAGWRWASLTGFDHAGNSTTVSCGYLVGYALDVDAAFPRRPPGVNAGAAVPLRFALTDAVGTPIADADALALVAACDVRVLLDAGTPGCAAYDATANRFHYVLKTPKSLTPGQHTVTIQVRFSGGTWATDLPLVIRP